MPVTQRWVHGGLILFVVVMSMCLTVLVLGATRPSHSDTGLTGSQAAGFSLKDAADQTVTFDVRSQNNPIYVLIFTPHACPELSQTIDVVQKLVNTYHDDDTVQLVGIASIFDPTLLGPRETAASDLEARSPLLHTARDIDGSVARAYRVGTAPTLFVIDRTGLIRARLLLSQNGAGLAAIETINSLRTQQLPWQSIMSDASVRR